jgi:hypothetical protein
VSSSAFSSLLWPVSAGRRISRIVDEEVKSVEPHGIWTLLFTLFFG